MTMNRRHWLGRAAACVSVGSCIPLRFRAQPVASAPLPARADFPIAEGITYLNNAFWHPLSSGVIAAVHSYLQRKATGSSHISSGPVGRAGESSIRSPYQRATFRYQLRARYCGRRKPGGGRFGYHPHQRQCCYGLSSLRKLDLFIPNATGARRGCAVRETT